MANGNIAYRIEEAIYNEVRSVELFVNESTISEKAFTIPTELEDLIVKLIKTINFIY